MIEMSPEEAKRFLDALKKGAGQLIEEAVKINSLALRNGLATEVTISFGHTAKHHLYVPLHIDYNEAASIGIPQALMEAVVRAIDDVCSLGIALDSPNHNASDKEVS